jgi:hypothetical protein
VNWFFKECYSSAKIVGDTRGGHGIREHILRMINIAAKLKPMDADLELKPAFLVHLVMASLPKEFDTFIVN